MIYTIHNLLEQLREKGIHDIEPYLSIGHNPIIGNMYEGLTKEIVHKSIFDGLDLRVVSGKISNERNELSSQIDCMVVIGSGEKLPYINDYIYDVNNVLSVIEVKKNLYMNDLESAYENLYSVQKLTSPNQDMDMQMLKGAYRSIAGIELPSHEQIKQLPLQKQMLYHALVIESYNPVRIIWGYEGFANETSLRAKYVEFLNNYSNKKGFGITSLPSLVICGNNTLIKTNGFPYAFTCETGAWITYASYNKNPLIIFLEILWTKLCHKFSLNARYIFEEDLCFEKLSPLLGAESVEGNGWIYTVLDMEFVKNKESNQDVIEWSPTKVTKTEYIFLNELCHDGEVEITSKLIDFFESEGERFDNVIQHLNNERIICVEDNKVKLITDNLVCCIIPSGEFVVADDANDRLSNWFKKHYNFKK